MRPIDVDLQLLRQFVVVADLESIGRAATALHMSASPLSRRIQQLEAQLGLELFRRERRRLRLSPEGRAVLAEARDLLARAARLEAYARALRSGAIGTLRLGFVEGAVHAGCLPDALAALRRKAPEVRVELTSMRSAAQREALLAGRIDAGFVYGPLSHPAFATREVAREPFVLVVPRASGLGRRGFRAKELTGQPFIALPEQLSPLARAELLAACERVGLVPDVRCEVADPGAALRLVAAGVGIGLVQESLAKSAGVRAVALPAAFGLRVEVHYVVPRPPAPLAAQLDALLADR